CVGGVCKPDCCSPADCGGRYCREVDNGTVPIPGFAVCTAGCDPMNPQAVCGPNVRCTPFPWDNKGEDVGDCYGPTGTGVGGGGCNGTPSGLAECAPGYYCTPDTFCRKWCRLGQNDCPDGGVCAGFNLNQVVIDKVPYGLCP